MILLYFILAFALGLTSALVWKRLVNGAIILTFLMVQIAFTVYACLNLGKTENIFFTYDALGVMFLVVLTVLSIATTYHGFINNKAVNNRKTALYHTGLIALIAAISGSYLANNLTAVWVFVEATTLSVAVLIYHERTKHALEATWKYIFVCSIGIALAYIGILFIIATVKNAEVSDFSFATLKKILADANPVYLKLAFVFVVIGYGTKMGLFPMHTVTVDAHTVAPPQISALISTALMNVGFLAIFRIYSILSTTEILHWMNNVLLLSGVLSVIVASAYMLKVKHFKRMFAYSSLENMGIVAIGLGIGGWGYYAAILHILLHSFVKASLFYQIGQAHHVFHTYEIDRCGNYFKSYSYGAVVLFIGFLAILALPPSGMFVSEIYILKTMLIKGHWIVFGIVVFFLLFLIYAMTRRFMLLFYGDKHAPENAHKIYPVQSISQFVLLAIVLIICFYRPPVLDSMIKQVVSILPM